MKKTAKKILSVLLAGTMLVTPVTVSAFTGTSKFMTNKTYTHQDRFSSTGIQEGIDVSYHNGDLDWSVIKEAGVDFAIIRAGYRGYGSSGTLVRDTKFAENILGAKSQGIPVGAYIYSQAITTAEAVQEANYILNIVKDYSLDLPIVFDYEFASVSTGRLDSAWKSGKLNKTKMTDIALAFCNTIKSAGYDAMVYASKSFLENQLDHTRIEADGNQVWLAHYTTNTKYTGEYKIWQYTSDGTIPGVPNKRFDANFMYTGFDVAAIPNQTYTGSELMPNVNVVYNGTTLSENTDYTVSYQNNVDVGLASVDIIGIGAYSGVISFTRNFSIVPAKVTALTVNSVGSNNADLSWSAVNGATGYAVQLLKNGKWTTVKTCSTEMVNVTGLLVGTANSVRVCAFANINGKDCYGAYSDAVQAVTQIGAVNPKVYAYSNNYITVTWDKQTAAGGYEVYKYDSAKKQYVLCSTITNPNTNTYKATGLASNTEYYFKVRAYKTEQSEKVFASFGTTLSQYTSVAKPSIKSAKSYSKKKIKVTWGKVGGASGYQVMWSTYKSFSKNYKTSSVSSKYRTKTVTTAQSKKTYYVRVRAYKTINGKKVYSPWSSTKKVKTK